MVNEQKPEEEVPKAPETPPTVEMVRKSETSKMVELKEIAIDDSDFAFLSQVQDSITNLQVQGEGMASDLRKAQEMVSRLTAQVAGTQGQIDGIRTASGFYVKSMEKKYNLPEGQQCQLDLPKRIIRIIVQEKTEPKK